MSTPELFTYVQQQLKAGKDQATIAGELRSAGWAEADIQAAFPTQAPQQPTSFGAVPVAPFQQPATPEQPGQSMQPFQPAAQQPTQQGVDPKLEKQRKPALFLSVGSIVAFLITYFIFGYVFVLAGLLGVYGASIGFKLKSKLIIILGIIGAIINFGMYILASIVNA